MLFCAVRGCAALGTWVDLGWGAALCDLHFGDEAAASRLTAWHRVEDVPVPW